MVAGRLCSGLKICSRLSEQAGDEIRGVVKWQFGGHRMRWTRAAVLNSRSTSPDQVRMNPEYHGWRARRDSEEERGSSQ